MKAGSYSSGRVSNPLLSYLLFKNNTNLTVNKSLKRTGYWRRIPPDTWGAVLQCSHHQWSPQSAARPDVAALLCTYFRTPCSATLSSCNCQWCQRALFGDWARPQLHAFCWSQLFWCNKIKVNPRHSLADSLYKAKLICKLVLPSEDEMYRQIFFCFLNLNLFLTDKLLSVK